MMNQQEPSPSQGGGGNGVSAQFLDAVSKAPMVMTGLTEGQKRMVEEARRVAQAQAQAQGQAGNVPGAPGSTTPAGQGQTPGTPLTPALAQTMMIKSSPQMVWQWIRSREDTMRMRFRESAKLSSPHCPLLAPVIRGCQAGGKVVHLGEAMLTGYARRVAKTTANISDEDKPRFVAETKALLPLAREAQEKMPKFLLIAVDRTPEDIGTVTQLISMVCQSRTVSQSVTVMDRELTPLAVHVHLHHLAKRRSRSLRLVVPRLSKTSRSTHEHCRQVQQSHPHDRLQSRRSSISFATLCGPRFCSNATACYGWWWRRRPDERYERHGESTTQRFAGGRPQATSCETTESHQTGRREQPVDTQGGGQDASGSRRGQPEPANGPEVRLFRFGGWCGQ